MGYSGLVMFAILEILGTAQAQLKLGFYSKSCPKAEKIVQDYVNKHIPNAPSLAAALIRIHFHDCFVRGCDASVLLNSTAATGNGTENTAIPNGTVTGFGFSDGIKSLLEAECPGVVSCADIVTLAIRDSIVFIGGPTWKVPTCRIDGLISNVTKANNEIPGPFDNFTQLTTSFSNKGLDLKDLVLLSGAHTIGIAHCGAFRNRLYNFTGVGDQDPSLDSDYATNLKTKKGPTPASNNKVDMDPGSRKTFDLSYYTLLLKKRGLFESDTALITESNSLSFIKQLLQGSTENFYTQFGLSMEKVGRVSCFSFKTTFFYSNIMMFCFSQILILFECFMYCCQRVIQAVNSEIITLDETPASKHNEKLQSEENALPI